jgi:trimeric autotransporter adhesin
MKSKQMIAGVSAAAVLAMVTPAYAGLFGGGAGAFGGSMTNASGMNSVTGQSSFGGRGAASTSFEGFPERTSARAKHSTTGAEPAQRSSDGTTKAPGGSAAHQADGSAVTAATSAAPAPKTTSSNAVSAAAPPSVMTSAAGAGSIDAQHLRSDNSVAVSGAASGSASRTQ